MCDGAPQADRTTGVEPVRVRPPVGEPVAHALEDRPIDGTIGEERATLRAGDCYFIPSDLPHGFTALGETEAIDVFSPVREDYAALMNRGRS